MNRYLRIYLNDQLFQQTLAIEIARRAHRPNADTELGAFLEELRSELEADRDALLRHMAEVGVRPARGRGTAARFVEKLGRLKLNGHLTTYSPLSRLAELDGLAQLIEGKHGFWLVRGLEEQAERARDQRERLQPHRLAAARLAGL